MPRRPNDAIDLQGQVAMATPGGVVHRLYVEDGPCLYIQNLETGETYEVCLDLVTVTPPTPATGEVLHGTGMAYAVFGPSGADPPTPTPPSTVEALIGSPMAYASFGEIPA